MQTRAGQHTLSMEADIWRMSTRRCTRLGPTPRKSIITGGDSQTRNAHKPKGQIRKPTIGWKTPASSRASWHFGKVTGHVTGNTLPSVLPARKPATPTQVGPWPASPAECGLILPSKDTIASKDAARRSVSLSQRLGRLAAKPQRVKAMA